MLMTMMVTMISVDLLRSCGGRSRSHLALIFAAAMHGDGICNASRRKEGVGLTSMKTGWTRSFEFSSTYAKMVNYVKVPDVH